MAFGTHIRTWFDGRWHEGDVAVMRAADHGIWQGSSVFDGARMFEGVTPDL
ncbi:MAG: branched chain amino acid aminotransferase, partial [Alphaproteobacteria bacterium HGW-Alphaproteobacteria-4]